MSFIIDHLTNQADLTRVRALARLRVHDGGMITFLGKQFQVCTRLDENGAAQIILLGTGVPSHDIATSFGPVNKISVWHYGAPLEKETQVIYRNGADDNVIFVHRSTPLSAVDLRPSIFGDAVPRVIDPQPDKIRRAVQTNGDGINNFPFRVDARQDTHIEIRYYRSHPDRLGKVPGVFQFIFGQEEASGRLVFVQARACEGTGEQVYQFP